MHKIIIFTSKTCPKCPNAKAIAEEVAKETDSELEIIDIEKDLIMALQHQIATVPSIMVDDEVIVRGEIPKKEQLLKALK